MSPGWAKHSTAGGGRAQCVPPQESWLEIAHVLGAAQAPAEPPGMVMWPKASAGNVCPGWMPVLKQSTDDADGRYSQNLWDPSLAPMTGQTPATWLCTEHPDQYRAPWGFGNEVVAQSREHLKTFTRSGLILLPLESSCVYFPFHCNHLLLLKLDKYFLSPAVSPLRSSSQAISCNNQNICDNFSHPKRTLFSFFLAQLHFCGGCLETRRGSEGNPC